MNDWSEIVDEVMPSVATIVISKSIDDLKKNVPKDLASIVTDRNGKFSVPETLLDKQGRVKIGSGSGFFVSPHGLLVTNKHVVIDPEAEYSVFLSGDDVAFSARILARDPIDDVAVIKIEKEKTPSIRLGNSDNVRLGEPVLAVGNALGMFQNSVASGIIAGLSRAIFATRDISESATEKPKELRGLIQTDVAINPGNSGGPLVNTKGEVIAINTAVVTGAQNLAFAIPINYAKRDLTELFHHGRIRRPMLGVKFLPINDAVMRKFHLPTSSGALIMTATGMGPVVVKGSPADKAGIKKGDIILSFNGADVTYQKTLSDYLEERQVGERIKLTFLRNGEIKTVETILSEVK
ncbi:MAG: PDZ domain-containing protein [Candidatus Harrisonbacteria bacterium]|nr:PDZ domain-containing protein [Candidatus Harrisonbacteria bacterium]